MALIKGTNCGFVTVAPTADPAGTNTTVDTQANVGKDTSPVGRFRVIEIGWYCDNATEAANYDLGIYTHDTVNNRPNTLIGTASTAAKGTAAGWKKISSLSIPIMGSTIYWIALQLDDTATNTMFNYTATANEKQDAKLTQTALPASWGVSDGGTAANLISIYALIERIPVGGLGIGNPMIF